MPDTDAVITRKDIDDLLTKLSTKEPNKFAAMLASRRFHIFLSTLMIVFAAKYGIQLEQECLLGIMGLAATLIAGDSYRKM